MVDIRAIRATGNASTGSVQKTRVYLEYPCYNCGKVLSGATSAIRHAKGVCHFDIPARKQGHNRPPNDYFEYPRDPKALEDEMHYGCPSCWFHYCPEDEGIRVLNEHVRAEHDPVELDISEDGDDTLQVGSRAGSVDNRSQQSDYDDEDEEDGNHGQGSSGQGSSGKGSSGQDSSGQDSNGQGSSGQRRTNANRGRNQTSDSGDDRRSSDNERSNGSGGSQEIRRSTTPNGIPITEESVKEFSSKLEELNKLFKDLFSSQN